MCILHHGYHFDEKKNNMKREEQQQQNIDTNIDHAVLIKCLDEQSSIIYPNSGLVFFF
jgi:hypothetical protein